MTDNRENQKITGPKNQKQKRPVDNKKRLWVSILLIAGVITVAILVAATRNPSAVEADSGTVGVRRQDLIVTVTEGGSIRAHQSIQYKCQVERRRDVSEVTILSIVPGGTYITQEDVDNGVVLVQLDSSALEEALTQEKMELAGDKENSTAAKEAYLIQELQNESDIADGKLNVRFALLDLQKYLGNVIADKLIEDVNSATNLTEHIAPIVKKAVEDPDVLAGSGAGEELKSLQDDIVMAEGNLKNAQDTLVGTIKLHDANYVSDLELQRDQLTVQNRQFSLESAQVALELFKDYDFPKNAEQYLSDYVEAGRKLERTYAECRSRLAQAQARLANANERFFAQNDRVNQLIKQIENCTIKARAPGLVIYGTGDTDDIYRAMRGRGGASSGIIAEGEVVTEGQVIISMPDTAEMVAEISVHETEVDKVRPGQPATIVMDAFPDKILQGEVIEVAPLPDQQRGWMNPDLKVYKTLVKLNDTHDFLRSRMSCKVQILVENLEDVLVVPIQVISNRIGKKVCYVLSSAGDPQEREVKTGIFNDAFVQIVDGLEEGEPILLNPPQVYGELAAQTAEAFQGAKPPQDDDSSQAQLEGQSPRRDRRRFEFTDEMAERVLSGLKQSDPEKAQSLEQLRENDPEKFKSELMSLARSQMRQRSRQGSNRGGAGFGREQRDNENRMGQESDDSQGR